MLYIIATPIGDPSEITLRALEILKSTENIICESTREASTLLKHHQITKKVYHVLNEHSTPEDLKTLTELCAQTDVALVSDCGTPVFCDPGASLIAECRKKKIPVKTILGASSLMGLLSLVSEKVLQFVFAGFLPAESEARKNVLADYKKESRALIFMDTPYRQMKLLKELSETFPSRKCLLVQNLTQETEAVFEGSWKEVLTQVKTEKAEFLVLIYPQATK